MESAYLTELAVMKKRILVSMENYMTGDKFDNTYDVSYSSADINECSRILAFYVGNLEQLEKHVAESKIMDCVRDVVLQLNELNDRRPDLITKTESEALCNYIEFAAKGAGLKNIEGDITERWREW